MKRLLVLIVILLALASIVAGKVNWDNKIKATTKNPENTNIKSDVVNKQGKSLGTNKEAMAKEELLKYTRNLPDEIVDKIEKAITMKEPVHLAIMGSETTPSGLNGWPALFKEELLNTYGEGIFEVTIKEIANKNSSDVVAENLYQDVIESKPDILLFEPFILIDNNNLVKLQKRISNLTTIVNTFKTQVPDVTILIQPANPLYNATYYPREVEELQRFTDNNGYIYLNHWEAWPDDQSPEINNYLEEGTPNELGHQVWAGYLKNYFISEE